MEGAPAREGRGREIKQKTKSSLHDNSPPPSAIFNPPPRLHCFSSSSASFSIIFPPCHSLFFSAKSVLIANHHGPAKWQIILHSFITKPSSSYSVSQHVQYVQLPCLLIRSASRSEAWRITQKNGRSSPPQINCNNIPDSFSFKGREAFISELVFAVTLPPLTPSNLTPT